MKKEETHRILITLPESMYAALRRISVAEDVPMAAIIRYALEQWMREQGIKVRDDIVWGGAQYTPKRQEESDTDERPEVMEMSVS